MSNELSRRRFLGLGVTALGAAALASCRPAAEPTAAPPAVSEEEVGEPSAPEVPAEVPEVHIWTSIALTRPEGSHPERYEEVQNYILEQTGVKPVGYVPPSGDAGIERRNLQLASRTERLDTFTADWGQFKDAVIPINDLLEQYGQNVLAAHPEESWNGMTDSEGNIWGVPRLGIMGHTHFTWFRTDWLESLGMDLPTTWDEMESAMTAFREMNPQAVVVTDSLGSFRRCWLGGFTEYGDSRWWDETAGELKPPELQPGFQDWLATMNEWWERDWLHREMFAGLDFEETIKTGNVGIHAGWYSRITILVQRLIMEEAVPGMQFDFAHKLTGPKGLCMVNNPSMSSAKMITKKCPDPVAVMKLFNWQYDPIKDNCLTSAYGIPGKDWEWADPDDKYYMRRLTKDEEGDRIYAGEFMLAVGLGTDLWYAPDDDVWRRHYEHMRDYTRVYDNGKMPYDWDVSYDVGAVRDKTPGLEDINRLISEETVKFITGVRPVSEYDQWVDQLYSAGLQDMIDAYTEQYLLKHPQ